MRVRRARPRPRAALPGPAGRAGSRRPVASGLALLLAGGLVSGLASASVADDPETPPAPSARDVADARAAVGGKARDVAAVQAELAVANARLQQAAMAAAQAAEAYNGARWRLEEARREARRAGRHAGRARTDVDRQQRAYSDAVLASYSRAPELSAISGVIEADGITGVIEQRATLENAQGALDERYDEFRAASTLAGVAETQADRAREEAAGLEAEAATARDAAAAAQQAAGEQAAAITAEKTRLIAELARLQDISVVLAERRQSALEEQALQEAAEAAAAQAASAAAEAALVGVADRRASEQADGAGEDGPAPAAAAENPDPQPVREPAPDPQPDREPAPAPAPDPAPAPPPPPAPDPAPAPARGAEAAISFARAQLGEPYVWGAAGPDSWDCSGLTMAAWARGGRYLPHYSVAQYGQSTPIGPGQLRPGDLVFWGSSSSPSSIYHVALYAGNGMIIHAPRTGRPVTEESMYYWIPPNFHARP